MTVAQRDAERLEKVMTDSRVPCHRLGITEGDSLAIEGVGNWSIAELRTLWEAALPDRFDYARAVPH